jgi:LytS/YehU family sensor histidine kinase
VLEKMRKNGAFDFRINVDQKVDIELIRIPPLLIQPYVENSIIHAFSELKTGGHIIISVEKLNEEQVLIKVVDNGQGLGNHLQSKSVTRNKKKSLGTLINNERIETLNALYSSQFSVTVENAQSGKGVWVEILIPLNLNEE